MTNGEHAHLHGDLDRERKQRAQEYRVAARREKRNRKADEKKQRKLNATILRRMTRNPDKYNKNAERNRWRAIELERRKIHQSAVHQAQHLAALHDPSGASFNVGPVVRLEDGTIITQEALNRRAERQRLKAVTEQAKPTETLEEKAASPPNQPYHSPALDLRLHSSTHGEHGEHPDRIMHGNGLIGPSTQTKTMSKKHQKRLALYEPRAPPAKPIIPDGISIPDGEVNWLELWDLSEDQLEKRVNGEKRRRATARKALRVKQKSGKAERRAARDEKRKVYREYKLEWKTIKEEFTRRRTRLRSLEEEESKKIAVRINTLERKAALELCRSLGFTIENTPGTDEIKPRALGMKGVDVDFDLIEKSDKQGDIRLKQPTSKSSSNRIDLAKVAENQNVEYISTSPAKAQDEGNEFIGFDVGKGQDYQSLTYNHRVRRKLRRAMDNADVGKEMLVRDRTIEELKNREQDVPPILLTDAKPLNVKGRRILVNGKLETPKQERVLNRMDLTDFNLHMKVLRKQAKEAAVHAGLRMHAELTGRIKKTTGQEESAISGDIKPSLLDVVSGHLPIKNHIDDVKRMPCHVKDPGSDDHFDNNKHRSYHSQDSYSAVSHSDNPRSEDYFDDEDHPIDIKANQNEFRTLKQFV